MGVRQMQKEAIGVLLALGLSMIAAPASAGNYSGDTLVRVQGTVVVPDASAKVNIDPTADADVGAEVLPT